MSMLDDIVVSGLGVVSPIGSTAKSFWDSIQFPVRGPAPFDEAHFQLDAIPNSLFFQVDHDSLKDTPARATTMAQWAAEQCLLDAGVTRSDLDTMTCGVVLGTAAGNADRHEHQRANSEALPQSASSFNVGTEVADYLGTVGPVSTVSTACSSGAYALALGVDILRNNQADMVLVGGAEGFSRVTQASFNRLMALDPNGCQPFSEHRRGTVLGEGAAILSLETKEHFMRRGAKRHYCRVLGHGMSCDAHHATAPAPDGVQSERAVRVALSESSLQPSDIGGIIPHATGTQLNDALESKLLRRVFGEHLDEVAISAIKAKLGHSSGAASAFSILVASLAIYHGVLPANQNTEHQAVDCNLPLHTGGPKRLSAPNVLVNAYAFGGNNISLILGA